MGRNIISFLGNMWRSDAEQGGRKPPIQHEFRQILNQGKDGHGSCTGRARTTVPTLNPGGPIRTFLVSLLGAATLTAGLFLVRQHQKGADGEAQGQVPAGERTARNISLERLRELGL